jgi:phage regulator Rha-like protein
MLDRDLALIYGIETKSLNLSVKRNISRFPPDFMFRLTKEEFSSLNQTETLNGLSENILRLQTETSKGRGGARYLPYAFTEQGVAMLSGVLKSERAIQMNIAIMRAFVEIRKILIRETDLKIQLQQIKDRIGEHDVQLNQIYDAIENLLDEKASQRNWDNRERIGFK